MFYHEKGYGSFRVPQEIRTAIKNEVARRQRELEGTLDLDDSETIRKLEASQEWVKRREQEYLLQNRIGYLGEKK